MNILTVKAELEGMLHGTTLNKIQNVPGVFNRAARQLLLDIDPQETKRTIPFATPIYDGVYNYPLPVDLKGNKIIDIFPQVDRGTRDRFEQIYNQDFDRFKTFVFQKNFTINFNTAVKTIRINNVQTNNQNTVNQITGVNDNGLWTGDGNAYNLTQDTVNKANGSGALKFDFLAGGAVAYVENSTMSVVDLSVHEDESSLFLWVYLPDASTFTNIILRWGSSSTNYWSSTQTTTHEGTSFVDGWNLIRFDWNTATKVLTPDSSKINYTRVSFTYDGTAQVAGRINNLVSDLGQIMQCEYYSKYLFRNYSTGAFQETTTNDADLINLDTETFNLFITLSALYAVQQALGEDSAYDTQFFMKAYQEGLQKYRMMYKSEIQLPKTKYYEKINTSWRRYLGQNFNW